ncbi:MAG TPA: hypothetical protein VKA01_08760 [Vicinamibacteria bacterium]|nr:hypothetical protein [Vicinamibacteria bacterium]
MKKPIAAFAALSLATLAHAGFDPDRLAGLKARAIGPAGMSGRVAAIAALESDPDIVYAGAATGGLWRSPNGGLTWEPLFDDQPVHAIGAVAVFQPNPSILWVGTGEANTRNSVSVGNGVYRSMDGGKTWKHAGLAKSERIYRIHLHPTDSNVAWVCATGPEWGEGPERGVFRTDDGGTNWKRQLFVSEKTGCGDLAADPGNPQKLIAAMWEFRRWPWFFKSGGAGSGLYVSHDGGASWRKLQEEDGLPKGELGRIGVAIAPSSPNIVYALVEAEKSALLRSDDGGRSFKSVNDKPSVAPRPFYFNDLRIDPTNPNRLFSVDYNPRVSEDAGKTWKPLPGATWALIHGDHHALWIHPRDPSLMYVGNDGGVAVSRDGGRNFSFVSNLPLAQYYHVAVDDERPYNVYGGLQDNGSWRGPSSVWQQGGIRNYHFLETGGGDGFETLPNPKDSQQGYSLSQGGHIMRWDIRTGEQRLLKPAEAPDGPRLRFNWNAALATDPFEPDTVYLGSQFVHRSRDRGETWETASPDLTSNNPEWQKQDESGGLTPDVTAAENHTTLVAIAPSAVTQGVIWTGSDDGRIHVTRDGGKSWDSVEKNVPGVPANTWVPHVEPSRFDAAAAFVVFDNHRRSDWTPYVYVTGDYGKTWRSLATPELRGYALAIRQDLVKPELLFLGTEFGLYVSVDAGESWTHLKKTLPTASVMDLVIHPREYDLVIGTHGRALYILDDIRPLRALTQAALDAPLTLFAAAPAQQYWQRNEEGGFGFGGGEFRGQNRAYGALLTYSLNQPGLPVQDDDKERARKEREREDTRRAAAIMAKEREKEEVPKREGKNEEDKEPKVDVEVRDAAGQLVRRFKGPARLGVNRVAWDLKRDPFKAYPRGEEAAEEDEDEQAGPEVPPGSYEVSVKYGDHEGKTRVDVVADPRSRNTAADWQRRWDAILKAGAARDAAVTAALRIRRTRDDVEILQRKAREVAEAAGERDKKKLAELPLVKAGETLKESLTKLEKRLWQAPESKGLLPDTDVVSLVGLASWQLQSSWEPPSPTQLQHLARAEEKLAAFQKDLEALFAKDVAEFRAKVGEAKLGLLP